MRRPRSSDEYTKEPHICPVCRKDDLEWGDVDYYDNCMSQFVSCPDCDSEWYAVFQIIRYADLDVRGKAREAELKRLGFAQ